MSKFWSNLIRDIEPYVPGEQPGNKQYIKLNTNENPYPPSPQVIEAIRGAADDSLRLYPTPTCEELRTKIGTYYNLTKEQVFVGNGSDEVLAFAFMAFFDPGTPILFPDITYSFYPVYASLFNIDYELVALDEEFVVPVDGFFKANGGIIFPNPNAPTGQYMPLATVEAILKHNPNKVVIVDEAYIDFGGQSAASLISQYANLLVIQTLSKSRSLAGLRVGFALGHEDLMAGLDRVKNSLNSYTLDRLALAGAVAAFKDDAYFRAARDKIIGTRERTASKLQHLGFKVIPSQANFLFISHSTIAANVLYEGLREKGVLIRYFKKPKIDNYLRVSIGSDAEMDIFLQVLTELIHKYRR